MYIHTRADLHSTISKCKNNHPNTLCIVAGDFNQANVESTMPEYKQYVICPPKGNGMSDHCYCKVKIGNKSVSRSCYGDADHATIMLISIYRQQLKHCRPKTTTVDVWMPGEIERTALKILIEMFLKREVICTHLLIQ